MKSNLRDTKTKRRSKTGRVACRTVNYVEHRVELGQNCGYVDIKVGQDTGRVRLKIKMAGDSGCIRLEICKSRRLDEAQTSKGARSKKSKKRRSRSSKSPQIGPEPAKICEEVDESSKGQQIVEVDDPEDRHDDVASLNSQMEGSDIIILDEEDVDSEEDSNSSTTHELVSKFSRVPTVNLRKNLEVSDSSVNVMLTGGAILRVFRDLENMGAPVVSLDRFNAMWDLRPKGVQYGTLTPNVHWGLHCRMLSFGVEHFFSRKVIPETPYPEEVDTEGVPYPVQLKSYMSFVQENMAEPGVVYNQMQIGFFDRPSEFTAPHRSDMPDAAPGSSVFCFTVCDGDPSTLVLKHLEKRERCTVPMYNNSLVIMGGGMQFTHLFSVPKSARLHSRRMCITIRAVDNDKVALGRVRYEHGLDWLELFD